jgi:hypothetical protein
MRCVTWLKWKPSQLVGKHQHLHFLFQCHKLGQKQPVITDLVLSIKRKAVPYIHFWAIIYCQVMVHDYRQVLDWWSDLWGSLMQRKTACARAHTMSTVTSSLAIAQQLLSTADIPLLLGSQTVFGLSYSNPQLTDSTPLTNSSLTNSQTGGHLTPTSYSSDCQLKTLFQWQLALVI